MLLQVPNTLKQSEFIVSCNVEDYEIMKSAMNRRFYLYRSIACVEDEDASNEFLSTSAFIVKSILEINKEDEGIPAEERVPIIIYIDSPGGEITAGFSLVSAIELSKTPVYTVNVGQWSSMAFLIGITGHKRFSFPNSYFLLHDGSSFAFGTVNKVQDRMEFDRRFDEQIIKQHVLSHSKMTEVDYNAVLRVEYYLLPSEALEKGFIDEIVTDLNAII